MKIAIVADIHGNPLALDAVLTDIQRRGGVDAYWILGDLCALGYDPSTVLKTLTALPNAVLIHGNTERYVLTGQRPPPSYEEVAQNPALIPLLVSVEGGFAWTNGYLNATGWIEWLRNLPLEQRITLPDGTRVLLVHAAPGTDDGDGLHNGLTDAEFEAKINGCEADLIFVGHFHMPMDRRLNGVRAINPGAVSNNFAPDIRGQYAILSADTAGYEVAFHRVAYDLDAAISAMQQSGNPCSAYVLSFYRGERQANWSNHWDGVAHLPPITE